MATAGARTTSLQASKADLNLLLSQKQQLLQQLPLHCGGSCRAHHHSNLCGTHGCSGDRIHDHSHLQEVGKSELARGPTQINSTERSE